MDWLFTFRLRGGGGWWLDFGLGGGWVGGLDWCRGEGWVGGFFFSFPVVSYFFFLFVFCLGCVVFLH